jgi:4-alpha-glucanotransferase
MKKERASGVLLHPTSLPGPYGIGDLGPSAVRFADFLRETGQTYWQILPLGPTGFANSPYSSFSAFAGNPFLVSPEWLEEDGLLDLGDEPRLPSNYVDFERVYAFKDGLLRASFEKFQQAGAAGLGSLRAQHDRFCAENEAWLADYTLFCALKIHHQGAPWTAWEPALVRRDPAAIKTWRDRLAPEMAYQAYVQFLFYRQWSQLKSLCRERAIQFIGDIPIYVSHDSADVWIHQDLFKLDERGRSTVVAGVPPDYFSETGQRWGNPIYRWDRMAKDGYRWWTERFRETLKKVDVIRLDHFLGFSAYWEIPAEETYAVKGQWVPGPGHRFFETMKRKLKGLPFVAENLGVVTPEAEALREKFGLPGMAIMQFSFYPFDETYHLYNYSENTFAYTGTHDNDTVVGWYHSPSVKPEEKDYCRRYMATDGKEVHWDFIRFCHALHTRASIVPLQDLMGKGTEARMNFPGRVEGNWKWRFHWDELTPAIRDRFGTLTALYGRSSHPRKS